MVTAVTNTEEAICNEALALIGEGTIASIDGTDNRSVTAKLIYPARRMTVQMMYPWRYTLKKVALVDTGADPLNEWEQAYTLPSDYKIIRALWDDNTSTASRIKRYEIYQQELHCDETEAILEYQIEITDPALFPPHFRQLLVYDLAAHFAIPFSADASKLEAWQTVAYGTPAENGMGGFYQQARRVDAQQQPGQVLTDQALVAVRY